MKGYTRLSVAIYNREILKEDQLKVSAEKLVVSNAEFIEAFGNAKVSITKLARYYLRSLETTVRGEDNPEFFPNESDVINLENVRPDSLGTDWPHIDPNIGESHFSGIGNLALLQVFKNSKIGNLSFDEKKEVYKESNFLLTSQISEVNLWYATAIENRQKLSAKLAVKT